MTSELRTDDFVAWAAAVAAGSMWVERETFGACIMNPPYRKVRNGAPERRALERVGLQITNLYPAFMGLAAELLEPGGQLSAITPRSFANGPYFRPFRRFFLDRMGLDRLHLYEKRGALFADADVLQENIVVRAIRGGEKQEITLSVSSAFADEPSVRVVPYAEVVKPQDPHLFIHIPVDERATRVAETMMGMSSTLAQLGVEVSTGRVVDFRTRENLIDSPTSGSAPLIYPLHLKDGAVVWPRVGGRKPNALAVNAETRDLLLPAGCYTLVKRFTAKEERRRVVAAPFSPEDVDCSVVAFENHLNVFHRAGQGMRRELALGLAVYLSSSIVDEYVRQFSGHTQINATDLRLLRYPTRAELLALGQEVIRMGRPRGQAAVDLAVAQQVASIAHAATEALAA